MDNKTRKAAVKGRIAQVDICPSEGGFVLSLGPVSLWLEPGVAEDVVETLSQALSLESGRRDAEAREAAPVLFAVAPDQRRKSN
jgi:hypothetical protein